MVGARLDLQERQAAEEPHQSKRNEAAKVDAVMAADVGDKIHMDGGNGSETRFSSQTTNTLNKNSSLNDDVQDQFSRLFKEMGASGAGQNVLEELSKPDTTRPTQPTQPNLIQCKVKFPKGKKPGDTSKAVPFLWFVHIPCFLAETISPSSFPSRIHKPTHPRSKAHRHNPTGRPTWKIFQRYASDF